MDVSFTSVGGILFIFHIGRRLVNVNILAPNAEAPVRGLQNKVPIFLETEHACYLLHTGFLVCLFLDLEDGGDIFIKLSINYMVLYPRRQNSS
jgi:hypothetical protein